MNKLLIPYIEQNFTSFKAEVHLEFNKMRQEMRDLINEKIANENLLKEVQELREAVQKNQRKKIKRNSSNKDHIKDNHYGSVSSKKSKESPKKKINFAEEENNANTSSSSRKGYVYELYVIAPLKFINEAKIIFRIESAINSF